MNHHKANEVRRGRRRNHVRSKITGTPARPRLSVFRSSKHIYAQLIDDLSGVTLAAASSASPDIRSSMPYGGNVKAAKTSGKPLAPQLRCIDPLGQRTHNRAGKFSRD